MKRRNLLAATVWGLAAPYVIAQNKPSRIIVAFSPGGPVDFVARALTEKLGAELKRTFIIDNKPGANGALGAAEVMRSAPDGTTLWLTSVGAAAINPSLYPKLSYDMQKDFAPVSLVANNVEVLVVNPGVPVKDAAEFVAWAKAQKAPVTLASSGTGSIPHLAIEQLRDASKLDLIHVPYKGAAPAITDVIGGQVSGVFLDVPAVLGHIQSGRLKALGMASPKRHPSLPEVRTFQEQGLAGVDSNNWYALFANSKVPKDVVASLNQAVARTLADPDVQAKLRKSGTEPATSTPAELGELLKNDTAKWAKLIKAKGIKAD